MAVEALKKFGKYFLLDMIAQGGMAEIYRARMATLDGGGRLLAVKRIIGNYSENREFVDMFKSEIKTTSGFTHPNIVQLYDYGEEDGVLYLAMELVDGKNLRQFMTRFNELKQAFPVEVAVFIMEQAAHGMGYAHGYKDKITGKPLNIVHRDISPQNLLISYDGAVKVIDFGIAKAATNNESTRAGVIKGKPSYLSPEQISGEVLDGRSDIFALGIVLWELLTGKKLFASDNDYGVLKLIENCQNTVKPPSMFNPKVPKELDAIVMKTLQKSRDNRYANAEEMQRALHKFLYQFAPEFNPADLAYYARDLFKNEIVEDRKRLLKLNDKVELLLAQPAAPAPPKAPAAGAAPTPPAAPAREDHTIALNNAEKTDPNLKAPPAPAAPKKESSSSFRMVELKEKTDVHLELPTASKAGAAKPGAAGAGPGGAATQRKIQYATSSTATNLTRKPGTNTGLRRKPEEKKTPSAAAAVAVLALLAGAYTYDPTLFGLLGSKPVASQGTGQRDPAGAAVGTITVTSNVQVGSVYINGEKKADALPATLQVPAGQVYVVLSSNGYKKGAQNFMLQAGESKTIPLALEVEGGGTGPGTAQTPNGPSSPTMLKVVVKPEGLNTLIRVNNQMIDTTGIVQISTERQIELIVERDGFRTSREVFTVHDSDVAGKREFVKEINLQQAKFGYVSIRTTPTADAIVTIDGVEEKWSTPVSRKRVPVGTYTVRLVNSLLGMEKQIQLTIGEDRFTSIEERLSISDAPTTNPRTPSSNPNGH